MVYMQHPLVELIGIDLFVEIMEVFSGEKIYIPSIKLYRRRKNRARLLQEFDGQNHKKLALKYNLSVRRIQQIVREDHLRKQRRRRREQEHAGA